MDAEPVPVSPFATLPVVYNRQRQFFLAATSYNLLALVALTFMFSAGFIFGGVLDRGLTSVLYYLAMNRWLLGFVDGKRQG